MQFPTLLSLFCGPGGLDLGFKEAGFYTQLAFDIDHDCVNTYAHNHPTTPVHRCDLRDMTLAKLDTLHGTEFRPFGVIGGPPCQSFSVANVHQADDDARHQLPETYASLLKQLNQRHPLAFFLFENVLGLRSKKHIHRYERFKRLFEEAGFTIFERVLNAYDYGVPQQRKRLFILGINRALYPHATWEMPACTGPRQTVCHAIGHLPEPVYYRRNLDPNQFPEHPNHWCSVPKSAKFQNGDFWNSPVKGRSFRRLNWEKPSWTVAYGHREIHIHPNGKRRLSIYEAMLLQSFPPTYRLIGNMSAQARLVSEAVPVKLAYYIAQSIRQTLSLPSGTALP